MTYELVLASKEMWVEEKECALGEKKRKRIHIKKHLIPPKIMSQTNRKVSTYLKGGEVLLRHDNV